MDRFLQVEEQEVEEWRKYPTGKSLGGHVKSHISANSAESEEKFEPNLKKVSSFNGDKSFKGDLGGHSGYGLRENPKKTFKAADYNYPLPQEKVCKQCGKGFQSMKALCGHMACHSDKDRSLKDDHSWTSENQKVVTDDSVSDTQSEQRRLRSRPKNKRYKRIIIKSSSMSLAYGSSSVSEIDEQEQEEVAMCLMMLSRDSSNWGGVNSVVESSDNNSVVLETKSSSIEMRIGRKEGLNAISNPGDGTPQTRNVRSRKILIEQENSDSGYFLGEEEVKAESDGSVDGFQRNASIYETNRSKMCVGAAGNEETLAEIRKGFGKLRKDRDRHGEEDRNADPKYEPRKKIKDSSDNLEMLNESCNKKVRKKGSLDVEPSKTTHKRTKYECLNCKKIFSSYQALGGHRPCHKRSNAYLDSRYETGENSLEGDAALEDSGKKLGGASFNNHRKASATNKDISSGKVDKKIIKSRKNKGHECPFCHRIFKNGQALGGHKRSHFIGGAAEEIHHHQTSSVFKADYSQLFDLNLPARPED